ncbi:type II secretion system F family protein [Thermosulfidibacter takaii]|nr:type II secretion system F family protein [Thermosulfidibacter takaii]
MAYYLCRVLYPDGKVKFMFFSEEEFASSLSNREIIILDSYRLPSWFITLKERLGTFSLGKVKEEELIDFAKAMSVMLRAGIPVIYALEDYAEMTSSKRLQNTILKVAEKVRSGMSLSEAFALYPNVFPEVFYRVIRIGEETGNLDGAFKDIADHLGRVHELKSNIKRALMYPAFVFVATFGALVFWIVYVLPKIVDVFTSMNLKLPTFTVAIVELSKMVKSYILYIVAFWFVFGFLVWVAKKKSAKVAYAWDWLVLRIPIVKLVVTNFQYAYIADFMRLLIAAGSNMDRVLELVANGVGNRVFKKAMLRIKEQVIMGESLSKAFTKEGLFPRFFVRMIRSGEESGSLEEQLGFAAEAYYEKLEDITEKMGKMIEPIVLLVVGGLFAIIMISLLSPIYDLIGKIGGM